MSAWICSHLHIKALAIYATNKTSRTFGRATKNEHGEYDLSKCETVDDFPLVHLNFDIEAHDLSDATAVARILMTENITSVCHRYDEEKEKYYFEELTADITAADRARVKAIELTPVQLIKLIHCLDYQSCEHPGWNDSLAKRILDELEAILVYQIPGYEEAPWGIDDDYTPPASAQGLPHDAFVGRAPPLPFLSGSITTANSRHRAVSRGCAR